MQHSNTLQQLGSVVGSDGLIVDSYQKAYYCKGFRVGQETPWPSCYRIR